MRVLRWIGAMTLVLSVLAPDAGAAAKATRPDARTRGGRRAATVIDNAGRMDVNNVDMFVSNHGSFAYDLENQNSGLIYPKNGTRTAVFASGIWIGAKVAGDTRIAVGEYSQEFVPGPMLGGTFQSDQAGFRNYRLNRLPTGEVDSTTADYLAWPVADGAPVDGAGKPALIGDAMIWSVYNDADPSVHSNDAGFTAPLGVEVQQTTFAFDRPGALSNIIFVKFRIINKGGNTLDSTYVSLWSDPDLGGFTDDLVGCDTTLSLGFVYNATNSDGQYGSSPPAVGYDFFRGPIVQVSPGVYDTLGMTSFNKYINGTDPHSSGETYNYMRGLHPDGTPIHEFDNPLMPITRFQVSGDPVAGTGWLDTSPADRRFQLTTGPFTMAPGDTQEIVGAIIVGQGNDRLSSISDLKDKDDVAQKTFDGNFVLPPPVPSPTVYAQGTDRGIHLAWGAEPVSYVGTGAGKEFRFEGFQVWQMSANNADEDATVIATFDLANGVTSLFADEKTGGTTERRLKADGTDSGLQFELDITSDGIRGGPLVNYKNYYYSVTGYAYDVNNAVPYVASGKVVGTVSELNESTRGSALVAVQPRPVSATFTVPAVQVAGPANGGTVDVAQLVQADLRPHLYTVSFDDAETWSLRDSTTSTTLLTGQTSVTGQHDSPTVDGFKVIVNAPRGVDQIGELRGDGTLTDLTPPNQDSTSTWHFVGANNSAFSTFFGIHTILNHDYEIRVLPDTTESCWLFSFGEVSFVNSFKIPFEAWDLGFNSLSDNSDDVKISLMVRDRDASGDWTWDDAIYFRQIPYASVAWGAPATKSTDYVPDGSDQTLGNFRFRLDDGAFPNNWPSPTTIRVLGLQFSSADAFQFTPVLASGAGSAGARDLDKVLAVPNPYYAHSSYELTQFDRVMKFTHIPTDRKVTLRIFNLGGDLVRTIVREPTSSTPAETATIDWNLNTLNNLPVASGIYIFRVEAQGLGAKTGRFAVFVERERLDNF